MLVSPDQSESIIPPSKITPAIFFESIRDRLEVVILEKNTYIYSVEIGKFLKGKVAGNTLI